jgi:hypothetical protein
MTRGCTGRDAGTGERRAREAERHGGGAQSWGGIHEKVHCHGRAGRWSCCSLRLLRGRVEEGEEEE